MNKEIYFSTDCEMDGRAPGLSSMLSIGSVAFSDGGTRIGSFERNLMELPDASADEETSKFWAENYAAWVATRQNQVHPKIAMKEYSEWIRDICKAHNGAPVFLGYPANYDFMFVYWYLIKFTGESPFGFTALDIKSYAMSTLGTGFRSTVKSKMPKAWFEHCGEHTHIAIDDAEAQGELFFGMKRDSDYGQLLRKLNT